MEEFLRRLATYLTETVRLEDVKYWHYTDYITVAGCQFYMYRVRRGKSVDFCGQRFKLTTYKVQAVADALLAQLPERLANKEQAEQENKRYAEACAVDKCMNGTAFSVYYSEAQYSLIFRHGCCLTIMAAIDYLQDGGFTSESPPPQTDAAKFRAGQMRCIWDQMSPEERSEFLTSTRTEGDYER